MICDQPRFKQVFDGGINTADYNFLSQWVPKGIPVGTRMDCRARFQMGCALAKGRSISAEKVVLGVCVAFHRGGLFFVLVARLRRVAMWTATSAAFF